MKTCDRCYEPLKNPEEHGWTLCPLEPRRGIIHLGIKRKYSNYAYGHKDKDTLQPFKKDGTVNKEFVQAHGTKSLEKEYKTTRQHIMREVERYG